MNALVKVVHGVRAEALVIRNSQGQHKRDALETCNRKENQC